MEGTLSGMNLALPMRAVIIDDIWIYEKGDHQAPRQMLLTLGWRKQNPEKSLSSTTAIYPTECKLTRDYNYERVHNLIHLTHEPRPEKSTGIKY